ncbi:hypothetical protein Rhal01_02590 [Rubritalea halochordaticola]|uniref:Uncharacterized protein n=1 Tax=Rubritalea halochordaticola TaxID=714537 RepID=A0ABP9V168_9BACT
MKPYLILLLSLILTSDAHCQQAQSYHQAQHGFSGGLYRIIDLSRQDGFVQAKSLDGLSQLARKVPGAIGFTAHPDFERGVRYAHAILWYDRLSRTNQSWPLYLFDQEEAQKQPGEAASKRSLAAAEDAIISKLLVAQQAINKAGQDGVVLTGKEHVTSVLAYAIVRLGGKIRHHGHFGAACTGCRSVVPGGNTQHCGKAIQGIEHWSCCGQAKQETFCKYWELRYKTYLETSPKP